MSRDQIGALMALVDIVIAAGGWFIWAAIIARDTWRREKELSDEDLAAMILGGGGVAIMTFGLLFGIGTLVKFVIMGW